MKLRLLLPSEVLLACEVTKVVGEGRRGLFCLLERHIDYVSSLVPGILSWTLPDGTEEHAAVDTGVLVKVAGEVSITVGHAVIGPDLGELRRRVDEEFAVLDDRERAARTATARLEANLVRRFLQLGP